MTHTLNNVWKNLIEPIKEFFKDLDDVYQDDNINEEISKINFPSFMFSNNLLAK